MTQTKTTILKYIAQKQQDASPGAAENASTTRSHVPINCLLVMPCTLNWLAIAHKLSSLHAAPYPKSKQHYALKSSVTHSAMISIGSCPQHIKTAKEATPELEERYHKNKKGLSAFQISNAHYRKQPKL